MYLYIIYQSAISRGKLGYLPVSWSTNGTYNEDISSDTDLEAKCIGKCETDYVECVGKCSDTECLLDCGREIAICENCMYII